MGLTEKGAKRMLDPLKLTKHGGDVTDPLKLYHGRDEQTAKPTSSGSSSSTNRGTGMQM